MTVEFSPVEFLPQLDFSVDGVMCIDTQHPYEIVFVREDAEDWSNEIGEVNQFRSVWEAEARIRSMQQQLWWFDCQFFVTYRNVLVEA
jgi:hypothetical protein